jgi:hypothetical protein
VTVKLVLGMQPIYPYPEVFEHEIEVGEWSKVVDRFVMPPRAVEGLW